MKRKVLFLFLVSFLIGGVISAEGVKPLDIDQITILQKHTVALIYGQDENGKVITRGSGFVVSSKGLLITANHAVEQNGIYQDLRVELNGKTYNVPKDQIVYKNVKQDLAAVKLPDGLYDFIPLNQGEIKKDDIVYSLGYPHGESKISRGEVFRWVKWSGTIGFRIDVESGTSGGALINQYGEAVGVIQSAILGLEVGYASGRDIIQGLIK